MNKTLKSNLILLSLITIFGLGVGWGQTARDYMDAGKNYLNQAKYNEAIIECRKVVDNFPNNPLAPEALNAIALCHHFLAYAQGETKPTEYENEINAFKELITKYPNSYLAKHSYRHIGHVYYILRDTFTAISWLEQAVNKYPEKSTGTFRAYYFLASCYLDTEQSTKCITTCQKMLDDYAGDPFITNGNIDVIMAMAYFIMDKFDDAIRINKNLLTAGNTNVIHIDAITYDIGEAYMYKNNYIEARIWFNKVIDNYPESKFAEEAKKRLVEIGQ